MKSSKAEIVKKFLDTAVACNWEKLENFCHEEFSVRESDSLPYAGVYKGIDGFRKLASIIFIDSFEEFKVAPQYFSEGDKHVLLVAKISGVGKKTNISFSSEVAEIYHFEENLIKEIQPFYWNSKLINDVLGLDSD
ncbi:MAG: nuclear transport factor 2 family protein [Gammaproteobacteria bacterium]|jgi:uncharacterized protein|nr:nuclear transport factor 2 family protein [Gammaproteobacteria bacterium]